MPEYSDPGKEALRMEKLRRWLEEKRKKAEQAEHELDFAAMSTIKEQQDKEEEKKRKDPEKKDPDKTVLTAIGAVSSLRTSSRQIIKSLQKAIEGIEDSPDDPDSEKGKEQRTKLEKLIKGILSARNAAKKVFPADAQKKDPQKQDGIDLDKDVEAGDVDKGASELDKNRTLRHFLRSRSNKELKAMALSEDGAELADGFEAFKKQAQADAHAEAQKKLDEIDKRLTSTYEFGDLKLMAAQKMYISQQMKNTDDPDALKAALSEEKMNPRVEKIYGSVHFKNMCDQLGNDGLKKQLAAGGEKLVATYAKVMAGEPAVPKEPEIGDFNTRPPEFRLKVGDEGPVLKISNWEDHGGMPH